MERLDLRGEHGRPGAGVAVVSEHETAPLSGHQRTVVILLCAGLTNGEIAKKLRTTEVAVTGGVSRVLHRLGLRNRVQLAVGAVKQGLL